MDIWWALSHSHVEAHHDDKADDAAPRRQLPVSTVDKHKIVLGAVGKLCNLIFNTIRLLGYLPQRKTSVSHLARDILEIIPNKWVVFCVGNC